MGNSRHPRSEDVASDWMSFVTDICADKGYTPEDFYSMARHRALTNIRMCLYWLINDTMGLSDTDLKFMLRRDRSSMNNYRNNFIGKYKSDRAITKSYDEMKICFINLFGDRLLELREHFEELRAGIIQHTNKRIPITIGEINKLISLKWAQGDYTSGDGERYKFIRRRSRTTGETAGAGLHL